MPYVSVPNYRSNGYLFNIRGSDVHAVLGMVQWLLLPKHTPGNDTADVSAVLKNNGIDPSHPRYAQNLAGTISEAASEGLYYNEATLSLIAASTRPLVELEMDSDLPTLQSTDAIVRYSALGMYYTSSITNQMIRLIEQTMARKAIDRAK